MEERLALQRRRNMSTLCGMFTNVLSKLLKWKSARPLRYIRIRRVDLFMSIGISCISSSRRLPLCIFMYLCLPWKHHA